MEVGFLKAHAIDDTIQFGVLAGIGDRIWIDVDADCRNGAKADRGDRQNARSASDIQYRSIGDGDLLQRVQHQTRRCMVAGPEAHRWAYDHGEVGFGVLLAGEVRKGQQTSF
jgi:hypothetical protein